MSGRLIEANEMLLIRARCESDEDYGGHDRRALLAHLAEIETVLASERERSEHYAATAEVLAIQLESLRREPPIRAAGCHCRPESMLAAIQAGDCPCCLHTAKTALAKKHEALVGQVDAIAQEVAVALVHPTLEVTDRLHAAHTHALHALERFR